MSDTKFILAVLAGACVVMLTGLVLDQKDARRNCEARYSTSTCNHILR